MASGGNSNAEEELLMHIKTVHQIYNQGDKEE